MSFVGTVRRDGTTTGTVPDVNPSSIVAVSGTPTRSTHGSCVNMDACTFPVSSYTLRPEFVLIIVDNFLSMADIYIVIHDVL